MMKQYVASSHVSVSVRLSNGGSTYVSFVPRSGGGSTYMTDSEEVQQGLEKHYQFGNLFFVEEVESEETIEAFEPTDISQESEVLTVAVSDLGEAKEYLAEHFGVVRSSIRSVKGAIATGERFGVVFEGLEE